MLLTDPRLSVTARLVGTYMLRIATNHYCQHDRSTIAASLHLSETVVWRAWSELRDRGYLQSYRKRRGMWHMIWDEPRVWEPAASDASD